MSLAKTESETNFVTNWISLTYTLRRSYSWLTVQFAETCDLIYQRWI